MSSPYIVTISSEKGGVGKTTLATNLAIYLKALHEDLPVTLLSFDNHFSVDQMFRISRQPVKGDVSGLFSGSNPDSLIETGEYGVQFIPSSNQLNVLRHELKDPAVLAKALAQSSFGGIVIIDTRPDLDIFTQNALYAADRAIIPVKDAPSMENCRHIYDFFDSHGLSRRPLRILPCLVDNRIHYDGPFSDPYQLLKAYAINRGYRCMEGFIAKSPKVESLNTNPEGKIYPILTHGRQTEVHLQMANVARQVYLHSIETELRRLDEYLINIVHAEEEHQSAYETRCNHLETGCLVCGKPLVANDGISAAGYFAQSSDGRVSGLIEEECFTNLVFRYFYGAKRSIEPHDPVWELFRESAQRSYFVLQRAPHTRNFYQQKLSFYRFDDNGVEVSHKTIELQEYEKRLLSKERSDLFPLLERTLFDEKGRLGDSFLLLRKVSTDLPEEILYDQNFADFCAIMDKVSTQLP
ncbi:MAG: ParA family protein [Desulfuromonadales bacterium]|nr:ParA family protein [Desulfuromonadales bacterium]